jgi:glycosyltransferase involved in cell wall biosynthesis
MASREAAISVVVATSGRPESLRDLLQALWHQSHTAFEVVVVAGPGSGGVEGVVDQARGPVKLVSCPERNLSAARNAGIAASAGELVAFIDDDAVPGSGWLEQLARAFSDPGVGGAGGRVYDRDGFGLQSRFPACDRVGQVRLDLQAPLDGPLEPDGLFPYLEGTNQCYRRSVLEAVGGFDDAFRYLFDEADLCARLADAGVRVLQRDGAPVVHRRLANPSRDDDGGFSDPEALVEGRGLFALRHGAPRLGAPAVLALLDRYVEQVVAWAVMRAAESRMTSAEYDAYEAAAHRGLARGRELASREQRAGIPDGVASEPLMPFVASRDPDHLRVCFVSRDLPPAAGAAWPADAGGVARYTRDLADAFAAAGHEVHLITGADTSELAWDDGTCVHRLADNPRTALASVRPSAPTVVDELANAVGVWHEVGRILEFGPLDVVSAPLFRGEGLVCALDERVPVVTTLHTSYRRVASMHPSWNGRPEIDDALRFERVTLAAARHVHALTQAALADARNETPLRATEHVLPLGVRDPRADDSADPSRDGGGGILFVGRLERRKGVDLLLDAFASVRERDPEARLTLAGQDSLNTETAETYRAGFERRAAGDPGLAGAVTFLGPVSAERLSELYAGCDVVCAPSRYESFGLVAVEAMAFGKPVVACATGGTVEVVRDGVDGLLAPADDAPALAERLARLLADRRSRERLGASGRQRFEEAYDLPVAARRIAAAYREVAAAGAGLEPGTVGGRLAGVLASLGLAFGAEGEAVARSLLDPVAHPIDWPQAVRALSESDDETFVARIHQLLVGRPPSLATRARYLATLARGGSRDQVVGMIATSEQAVRRHGAPQWLANLPPLPPASAHRRFARAVARRALRTAYRASRRSGAYAAVVQVLRAQARAVAAEALEEVRATQRAQAEEEARERARLAAAVDRLEARLDRLDESPEGERRAP